MMLESTNKKIKIYFYLFLLFFLTNIYNVNITKFLKENFLIKKIIVSPSNLNIEEINKLFDENIFRLSKSSFKNILSTYPFLKSFEIKKIYPNTLQVRLIKSKPIAKIVSNERYKYLGENEKIFYEKENYSSIPLINGEINKEKIIEILNLIQLSSFNIDNISEIKIYPSTRFDLFFKNKTILKFPNEVDLKFLQFAYLLKTKKELNKKVIDLRLPKKVVVSDEWFTSFFTY